MRLNKLKNTRISTEPTFTHYFGTGGEFVVKGTSLDRIFTPTGYVKNNALYHYIHDHQGNVRQVVDHSGTVVQDNHYYPYGALFGESSATAMTCIHYPNANQDEQSHAPASPSVNPYKYGGKELLTFNGANLYDFTARMYDPLTGRFGTQDKMQDDYASLSSYLYCAANPINLIDPTGEYFIMPKETPVKDIYLVMYHMQKLSDDKFFYKTQSDGTIRIGIKEINNGKHPKGTNLIRALNSSKVPIEIICDFSAQPVGPEGRITPRNICSPNKLLSTGEKGIELTLFPNDQANIPTLNKDGTSTNRNRPFCIGMAHELIHALRSLLGAMVEDGSTLPNTYTTKDGKVKENPPIEELETIGLIHSETITENEIRKEQGEPNRTGN